MMFKFLKSIPRSVPRKFKGARVYLATLVGLGLLGAGCRNTPGYVYDIFTEMHYSQSYRLQEPPRLLPPAQSVPVTGKEVA